MIRTTRIEFQISSAGMSVPGAGADGLALQDILDAAANPDVTIVRHDARRWFNGKAKENFSASTGPLQHLEMPGGPLSLDPLQSAGTAFFAHAPAGIAAGATISCLVGCGVFTPVGLMAGLTYGLIAGRVQYRCTQAEQRQAKLLREILSRGHLHLDAPALDETTMNSLADLLFKCEEAGGAAEALCGHLLGALAARDLL